VEAYGGPRYRSIGAFSRPASRSGWLKWKEQGSVNRFVSGDLGMGQSANAIVSREFIDEVGIPRSAEMTAIQNTGETIRMVSSGYWRLRAQARHARKTTHVVDCLLWS
jgi:hypothetical protein